MVHNQVFVPTVAEFPRDIETSWELQKPLADIGYRPGLMLVVRGADAGKPRVFDKENVKKQYDNLAKHAEKYGNADIVTMLPNMPVGDIDFLHNGEFAKDHVLAGIEFARGLPIGGRRLLTFHTNNFVSAEEFVSQDIKYWIDQMQDEFTPRLKQIRDAGKTSGVKVLVETYPMPVFGDYAPGDGAVYRGVHLRDLREVSYIMSRNTGEDIVLREAELGICLDVCHARTVYQAVYNKMGGLMFDNDIRYTRRTCGTLMNEFRDQQQLVHLNDGLGRYTSDGGIFKEGVALGQGDIGEMPKIVEYLNNHLAPFVLEINETDFDDRPNTRESINYLLRLAKAKSKSFFRSTTP